MLRGGIGTWWDGGKGESVRDGMNAVPSVSQSGLL